MPRTGGAKLLAAFLLFSAGFAGESRAAFSPTARYGHVTALLPNGKTLVAGGSDVTDTPIKTVEILDTTKGSEFVAPMAASLAASMSVARSSAAINVLPNGKVLVTGGWDGAVARSDAEVYDPVTDGWTTVAGMSSGRFNHTATLLNSGNVLVCGGQTGAAAVVTATCDLFTPSGAGGSFAPTGSLLAGRELHTATLLNDGTVWIAGGYDGSNFLVTTERYSPSNGQWQQSQVLNVARAYHTATMTGDNKVLVVGGFNGRSLTDPLGFPTLGLLSSTELYDPTGGAIVPGAPTKARVSAHTALLKADGELEIAGGIANVPAAQTALVAAPTFVAGSSVTGSLAALISTYTFHAITGGTASLPLQFYLATPVTGRIINGDVEFVNPVVNVQAASGSGAAKVAFVSNTDTPGIGLRANLAGVAVGCDSTGVCGYVSTTTALSNVGQGSYSITVPVAANNLLTNTAVTGQLFFSPSPATAANSPVSIIGASSFTAHLQLAVPDFLTGHSVSSVTLTLSPKNTATWAQGSSYTVTLNGGSGLAAGPFPVITAAGVNYIDIPAITINNLTGILSVTSGDSTFSLSTNLSIPINAGSPGAVSAQLSSFNPSMSYSASGINLAGQTLIFAAANVVVRTMVSGDEEFYDPKTNQWTFSPHNGTSQRPGAERFGASSVLLPGNDELMIGGKDCGPLCATFVAANLGGTVRSDSMVGSISLGFTASTQPDPLTHAFHTANLLPDGTILLAGGTDGSSVLKAAEVFNPATGVFAPTASFMAAPREQHTATLLPNGRVLLAGGFTATSASTGPTNAAEIYYPDTRMFIPTSVMASSRSQHVAIGLPNGNVFVAGGFSGLVNGAPSKVTGAAEIYYSTASAWFPVASMPAGQERAIAAAVQLQDGRIALFGGTNQTGVLSTVVAYDLRTNSWSSLHVMPSGLQGHTATLLPDGRVLIVGGDDGFGETNYSFIYDPITDSWTTTASLGDARFGHDATLLPNGTVMVSGGVQQSALGGGSTANAVRNVEFFHPDGSFWIGGTGHSPSPLNLGARAYHTVTLAPSGNVYFLGGANGSIGSGQSASFYTQYEYEYFTALPDGEAKTSPSLRQSTIAFTTPSPFLPGTSFTASGLRFRGATEGGGSASGPAGSSFNSPHLLLQKFDGSNGGSSQSSPGFIVNLTTPIYANPANLASLDTSLAVTLPGNSQLPYGWYMTWVGNNEIYTAQAPMVQVGPAKPSSAPTGLRGTTQGVSSVTWTWSALAGVDGYNVYQSSSGVFLGTVTASGSPFFAQTGLAANTTASIRVAGFAITGDGPLALGSTIYTYPNPPTNVSIASVTFNSLMLQWNANGNLPGTVYEISESRDGFATDFSTPVPSILGITSSPVVISQLQANTTYTFRVQAFNTFGTGSAFSATASTLTRTSVGNVSGTGISATAISWVWTDARANSYNVYNSSSGLFIGSTTTNGFIDSGLGISSLRSISVTAVTAGGEGPLSASATSYTLANTPLPLVPTLTTLTTYSLSLGWSNNGNPNGTVYDVNLFQYTGSSVTVSSFTTSGFLFDTVPMNIRLVPGTRYDVYVAALNGAGTASTSSFHVSTYTPAAVPVFNALSIAGLTPTSVSLQWDKLTNPSSVIYEVSYSTSFSPSPSFLSNVVVAVPFSAGLSASSATVAGLNTSTTYYFWVRAQNVGGNQTLYTNPPLQAITTNGGAALGSLAGTFSAAGDAQLAGNLGNGRYVSLRAPAGTFPTDTIVTISSYNVSGTLCANGLNVAVSIVDSPALQPVRPVYLTASYLPAELGSTGTSGVSLARYDPATGVCVPLETSFDSVSQRFTARLNHFSLYQLVQTPLASTPDSARVYPNPFRAATDGYVTVDRIPPGSRVRVTTLRGETVLDETANSSGMLTWSATNGSGRNVASGLYLILVESGGSKKILKLAVIR